MKLRELMSKIVKPKGMWTQTAAEQRLGIPQWKLSNFKLATDESEYEKAWQDFLRLIVFCREHGIDPAKDLLPPTAQEVITDVESNDKTPRGAQTRAKARVKKKGLGPFQAGGIKGS